MTRRSRIRLAIVLVPIVIGLMGLGLFLRARRHEAAPVSVPPRPRCTGTKLTLVARLLLRGEWENGRLRLRDRQAPGEPARFVEPSTLEIGADPGPDPWAKFTGSIPAGTRPVAVESDRWLIVMNHNGVRRVVDTTTNQEIAGFFPGVEYGSGFAGGRAITSKPGELAVIELASGRELFHCATCEGCAFGERSTTGRAIHCYRPSAHSEPAVLIDVDEAAHQRVTICTAWERTSPDDTYVLSLPARSRAPACVANPFVSWRPTFGGASHQVSAPVNPMTSRFEVAFCGGGELFFTYSSAGSGPNVVSMFRGRDASLVSTMSGPEGASLASATIRAEMDGSGRYLAFFAERPNDLDETWLYRLDP